ncbi:Ureidoglycolate hydrolase [Marinobacterium lacunae]|uniref:Ureidoglycolate hydrolase n=1 Tax=Marinobacterium lacunae TaxID=1232683 RepID=A0A081G395_9GAMM|nr:ureidoglycolate lyase [Marinobacterium lacunae]KEA65250.1 Ureidoglycolate hydrolase [Marinobacterium lacunae]
MSRPLALLPLTRERFAPFGDVIEMDGSRRFDINQGATERYHDTARIFSEPIDGYPSISLARSQPLPSPLTITMLERHPLASQAFIPWDRRPFVVVVAPVSEKVASTDIRAFVSNGQQGISYHPGVWHHSLLALSPDQDFIVVDLVTQKQNCEEYYLGDQHQLTIDFSSLLTE